MPKPFLCRFMQILLPVSKIFATRALRKNCCPTEASYKKSFRIMIKSGKRMPDGGSALGTAAIPELFASVLVICMVQLVVGGLLMTNDPPRPGIGLRTKRMLNNPGLRRRTEQRIGRWYIRVGVLSTVFTVLVFLFERNLTFAFLD
jgi:hypothetical protein